MHSMNCVPNCLYIPTYKHKLYEIIHKHELLHVSAMNCHPQGDLLCTDISLRNGCKRIHVHENLSFYILYVHMLVYINHQSIPLRLWLLHFAKFVFVTSKPQTSSQNFVNYILWYAYWWFALLTVRTSFTLHSVTGYLLGLFHLQKQPTSVNYL
jgi:hypothetical protein